MSNDEVTALWQAECKLATQWQALNAKLVHTSGDDVLDSFLASGVIASNASELADVQSQLEAIERAITSARQRRIEAIKAHYASAGETIKQQAAQLRTEATERQRKTDDLLSQLKEFEGCEFGPITYQETWSQVGATTKTATILEQAEQLERRATAKESEPIRDFGQLQAASPSDVLRQLEALDPLTIGPMMPDVARWLSEHSAKIVAYERKARKSNDGWRIVAGQVTIVLSWRDGSINVVGSRYDWTPVYRDVDTQANYTVVYSL